MAVEDLVFRKPPADGPPNVLVLGEPDEPTSGAAHAFGRIPLPPFMVVGAIVATLPPRTIASGSIPLPAFMVSGEVRYDSAVSRPLVNKVSSGWQVAQRAQTRLVCSHQVSARAFAANEAGWQRAQPATKGSAIGWQEGARARNRAELRYEAANPLAAAVAAAWQESIRARNSTRARWQADLPLVPPALAMRYQEALRMRRAALASWQSALRVERQHVERFGLAHRLVRTWRVRYQEAMPPLPGTSIVVPPVRPPCYVPSTLLALREPQRYSTTLIFVCEHDSPGGPGLPPLFIPFARFYMATHHLDAVLLPSLERVPLSDVTIEADAGMPHWRLSATGPIGLLDQLGLFGSTKQIRVTVDGLSWVFAIEGRGRSRAAGDRRARITGRSVPALLGASRLASQTWLNSVPITAAQIVNQALQFTEIGVDWQIPDWLVPAGAWSFKGKPLAAAVRVAEAVGAVLQSHPTDPKLVFLPRYPKMPWEWDAGTTVPDVSISGAVMSTDEYDVDEQPAWEAVYVYGTAQGVARRVKRAGTAGDVLADQVTDDLITAHEAAIERGRSVLGAGGNQAQVSISMPILTGGSLPGVLGVNQLLEVIEPAEAWRGMPVQTWRGLVRAVTVRASQEEALQSVRVERHFL